MIAEVKDRTLQTLLAAERAILILTRSDCGPCKAYEGEVGARLKSAKPPGISIARFLLDRPGSAHFKHENPWISSLRSLPYTLHYRKGQRVDGIADSRASHLLEHIEDNPQA